MKPNEIIDEMNDLLRELEDVGETIIDCVIDAREDEGLPPMTPEEYALAVEECDRNAEKANAIDQRISDLRIDYKTETGEWPHYIDFPISRYSQF